MADMIKFYRGLAANLPEVGANGALYITTDEGSIHLGTGDGMKRLGDFIQVAGVANLPVTGANTSALYYCIAENILAKWNSEKSEWTQINKQPTADQIKTMIALGDYETKSDATAKLVAAKKYTDDEVKKVQDFVGVIPEGYTEETIVAYINKKAEETLNSASGGSSESAASVLAALNTYKSENDPKVQANTDAIAGMKNGVNVDSFADVEAELDKKVDKVDGKSLVADTEIAKLAGVSAGANKVEASTNGNIKIDGVDTVVYTHPDKHAIAEVDGLQAALDGKQAVGDYATKAEAQAMADGKDGAIAAAKTAGDNAQAAVDALAGKVGDVAEGKTVVQMIADAQSEATYDDTALVDRIEVIEGDYLKKADKEALQNQINLIMNNPDTEKVVDSITEFTAWVEEHGTLAEGMRTDIDANEKAIADEQARAEAKEAELVAADEANLAAAKKYADDEIAALNVAQYALASDLDAHTGDAVAHITADERAAWNAAEGNAKTYADGLKTAVEGAFADADAALKTELQGYADQAETDAKAHADAEIKKLAEGAVAENTAAIATKAAQSDLNSAVDRIGAAEGKIAGLETASATHALKTEVEAVQTALNNYKDANDGVVAGKADKATTLAGYGITDAYTKAQVDALMSWVEF